MLTTYSAIVAGLRFACKVLLVIWPFLKSAVFKERNVVEVLRENKHITCMLILILLLISALAMTTMALSEYKEQYQQLQAAVKEQGKDCLGDGTDKRRKRLLELLKEEL